MLRETSLNVAKSESSKQHLVVPTSRKMKSSVAVEFENWLKENNYSELTSADYMGRIERLCKVRNIRLEDLVANISEILPEYENNGKQSSYGKRSHTSVRQALRRFKMFLVSLKLIEA